MGRGTEEGAKLLQGFTISTVKQVLNFHVA